MSKWWAPDGGMRGQRVGGGDMIRGWEAPAPPPPPPSPPAQTSPPCFSINTLCSLVTLALIVCEACSLHSPLPQTIKSGINTLDCFHCVGARCFSSAEGGVKMAETDTILRRINKTTKETRLKIIFFCYHKSDK